MKQPTHFEFAVSAVLLTGAAMSGTAQQPFTGRISDSACGLSHAAKASTGAQSDRQCLLACINALAKYVLVDSSGQVVTIANQDAMGLPLYAGRPVKITGDRAGDAIIVSKIEAIAAHLHLGHVMTNWRDTPGARGFLPVAIDEARVVVLQAGLAAKGSTLEDIHRHAGLALHALDPAIEPAGPDMAYGLKKALAGALQHLDLAARAEGATPTLTANAPTITSALGDGQRWAEQSAAAAQSVRAATDHADAAARAAALLELTARIGEALARAQSQMNLILKGENLLGAPR